LYYQKSDEYIKDREAKIVEMENEVKRLHEEYASFDERFSSAKNEATELKKRLKALE
jgi:predicted nuclease with TOPRIM domain